MAFNIGDIIRSFKQTAGSLMAIWNALGHVYEYVRNFLNHILTLFQRIHALISDIETEINEIKNFEFDPRWRTRVISVPVAYEKLHRLATEIPSEVVNAVKDLVQQLRSKFEAAPEKFDAEELESDLKLLPEKLAKMGEKVLAWVTLITDAITSISAAVDDLQTLVSDFREIRQDIENLDAIFLPNRGPRKFVDIHYRKRNAM
jgi:methyl-accepting chemotaxis protein